ncbi:hypothetical protein FA15DRAFT_177881 [Coprinopsis marcescibilis]|uniref:Uncharacterized protein n=1 Tax=Coprinopsis marcescibilis TaxID=230819 RepID=A0A5C3LAS1_COPMA|nr:hypothetical protein FA15DRAFT_177881 [Coprinopsis marcescibilis]
MPIRTNMAPKSKSNADDALKSFISRDPNGRYTFSSERDSKTTEICNGRKEDLADCIMLQMNARRLFESMQEQGFFCALPSDPEQTHMECKPLPK